MVMIIFIKIILFFILILEILFIIKILEYLYCAFIKRQPPLAFSSYYLRKSLVDEINNNYKNVKTVLELGSGYGGLAKAIAKKSNKKVIGIENMPITITVSRILNFFDKKLKIVKSDVFEYLENTNEVYDMAIAYLGPRLTNCLFLYKNKFKIFISLDFEIENVKPKKVIDLKKGYTLYDHKKYPHKIYIYEF